MNAAAASIDFETPPAPATLDIVDRQLARGFRFMRFEPALEHRFETEGWRNRTRHLTLFGGIAVIVYDLFLLSDWVLTPDVFVEACILRLAIFTPLALTALAVLVHARSVRIRESLVAGMGVLSVFLIMILFVRSASPYRSIYHYGPMLIMAYGVACQRLRLSYSIVTTVLILLTVLLGMAISGYFSAPVFWSDAMIFLSSGILLSATSYGLERETRLGFLLALRSRLLNEQLDRNAKRDPLTGLWNRRHLNEMMSAAWAACLTAPESMGVVLLDLDFFKRFNDAHGHLEGDACLERIAHRLVDAITDPRAVAVRYGGEEFMIFLPGFDAAAAEHVALRLCQAVRDEAIPHPSLGSTAIVTASLGVAAGLAPTVTSAGLIAAADAALYEAKNAGRDRISLASGIQSSRVEPQP